MSLSQKCTRDLERMPLKTDLHRVSRIKNMSQQDKEFKSSLRNVGVLVKKKKLYNHPLRARFESR